MKGVFLSVAIVFVIMIVLAGALNYIYNENMSSYSEECLARGEHLYNYRNTVICLTDDGRIVEIPI